MSYQPFWGVFLGVLDSVLRLRRSKCHFLSLENGHFWHEGAKKFTTTGTKRPRAKTKTFLKPMNKMKQLVGMPIVKFRISLKQESPYFCSKRWLKGPFLNPSLIFFVKYFNLDLNWFWQPTLLHSPHIRFIFVWPNSLGISPLVVKDY